MKRIFIVPALAALAACTAPAAGSLQTGIPVFFQPWSAALSARAVSIIASAATQAQTQPNAQVLVTGAADSTGSAAASQYLSQTRAQMVADQLEADGVSAARIVVRGAGAIPASAQAGTQPQAARRVLIQIQG